MKSFSEFLFACFALVMLCPVLRADGMPLERSLYFPPDQGEWETVDPEQVGWDRDMLQEALDYAGDYRSSGVVILFKGRILAERTSPEQATTSSQSLNPFYGYLWWLNHNAMAADSAPRVETAPRDMFSANGALNRRCFVVPSLQLVVTRLGDSPDSGGSFDRDFWKLLAAAARTNN